MTILASLTASAEAFEAMDRKFDAHFTREMIAGYAMVESAGFDAEPFYRHWAEKQAERVQAKLADIHPMERE